jgi:hypothetical protein
MNDIKTVMNQLKILRQDSEITVNEVSEYIEKALGEKISPKTIYGWESGMAKPTIPVFMCMCMCYKISNPLTLFTQNDNGEAFEQERLYKAYVRNPDMQKAVKKLLKIK